MGSFISSQKQGERQHAEASGTHQPAAGPLTAVVEEKDGFLKSSSHNSPKTTNFRNPYTEKKKPAVPARAATPLRSPPPPLPPPPPTAAETVSRTITHNDDAKVPVPVQEVRKLPWRKARQNVKHQPAITKMESSLKSGSSSTTTTTATKRRTNKLAATIVENGEDGVPSMACVRASLEKVLRQQQNRRNGSKNSKWFPIGIVMTRVLEELGLPLMDGYGVDASALEKSRQVRKMIHQAINDLGISRKKSERNSQ